MGPFKKLFQCESASHPVLANTAGAIGSEETEKTRRRILEAASKLFAEKGYEGTSVREISKLSGTNISMISYYFGSKEELYRTVIREFALFVKQEFDLLIEEYKKMDVSEASFKMMIEGFITLMIVHRRRWPDICQILEREKISGYIQSRKVHEEVFFPIARTMRNVIVEGQEKGFVNEKVMPDFFFGALIESIKGVMIQCTAAEMIAEGDFKVPQTDNEFKEQFMNLFMKGLLR